MKKKKINWKSVLLYIILSVGLILIIVPLYLAVITAFKPTEDSIANFFAFPKEVYLDNFRTIIRDNDFFRFFWNSVIILIGSMVGILIIVPLTAYVLQKNIRKPYYKVFYMLLIMGVLVPFQVIMLPVTQLMSRMNLMHQGGLILLYITFAMTQGVFLYSGYIRTVVPLELEEAAYMDGCGIIRAYISIIFPLMKPMTGTVIILNSLWIWNDFLLPLLVLNKSKSYWTLVLFQYNFKSAYSFDFNLTFATFVLSIIPIIIVYIIFQKHIIEGLTAGAVKS